VNAVNSGKNGRGGNWSKTLPCSEDYVGSWDKFILMHSSPVFTVLFACKS